MLVYFLHCIIYPCFLTEHRDQKFTNSHVIKDDTVGIQKQESATYLLRIAVIGLTFVVTILFVSYLCLTYRIKRNRATHEDIIIINEWRATIVQYVFIVCTFEQRKSRYFYVLWWLNLLSYVFKSNTIYEFLRISL